MTNKIQINRFITRLFSGDAFLYSPKYRNFDKALSLEEFMFRAKVKSTYRKLIRIIYRTHEKEELLRYAKHEFAISSQVSDLSQRRYLLNDGVNKINQMLAMMDLQGSKISND